MKATALAMIACAVMAACGCVERKMMIRSEPEGAPVWVNEACAGTTPLEYPFAFYGTSGIRVGPLRDPQDRLLFKEAQVTYKADAPWYETFPIDFFFEVLWPGTLTDVHQVPEVKLQPAPPAEAKANPQEVQDLIKRAENFRTRALEPVPDEPPAQQPVSPRPPG
jgi:hypothetical protein